MTELDASLAAAVEFLRQSQLESGAFQSFVSTDPAMVRDCVADSSPFPTALLAYCLGHSRHPSIAGMMRRALGFLEREMEWPGVWRYWTADHPRHNEVPPDLDDIACASYVLRQAGGRRLCNRSLLAANRDARGLFYTWLIPRQSFQVRPLYWYALAREALKPSYLEAFFAQSEAEPDDIDCVVNANVLLYLGESSDTRPVIDYLIGIVRERREGCCDKWHLNRHTVYYMVSRNYLHGARALGVIKDEIVTRLLAGAAADGGFGSPLDTALALCTMLSLQVAPPHLDRAARHLLAEQTPTGAWPRSMMYYGGPNRAVGWGSEELTTGFCVEALQRYADGVSPTGGTV